jgi:hypothetical protein
VCQLKSAGKGWPRPHVVVPGLGVEGSAYRRATRIGRGLSGEWNPENNGAAWLVDQRATACRFDRDPKALVSADRFA